MPKSTKSKSVKVATTEVAPTPAAVEVAAPVEVSAEATAPVDEIAVLDEHFKEILGRIQEFRTWAANLQAEVKKLHKNVGRSMKENAKKNRKRKVKDVNKPKRAPSGFAKPALISDELCAFLEQPKGTEMARTEVTKHLTKYIKEHSLQDQANKRKILPDKKLGKLLNVGKNDEVTYFNLQKYMKVHFPKSVAASTSSA